MSIEAVVTSPEQVVSKVTFKDRVLARLSSVGAQAGGFIYQPQPRLPGLAARGRQLIAGNFRFGGHLVQAPDHSIWDISPPDRLFEADINGFTWLDDLACVGDGQARALAQGWVHQWIMEYGAGRGVGWAPDLTGRRLIRWISHALFLLNGNDAGHNKLYFRSLAHQTTYLARRWPATYCGLPRFEALTGLIYAGISLIDMEEYVAPAMKALAGECRENICPDGGLPSRNPEELLNVLTLLIWAKNALEEAGYRPLPAHKEAIEHIVPTLRNLRHADGGLARFHGGGRATSEQIDYALAAARTTSRPRPEPRMGFSRLSGAATSVVVDVAPPPERAHSRAAHASTLAFELTSGRRPLIANCGSGVPFGLQWCRAGRATQSHSTLSIRGASSAKLAADASGELIAKGPGQVTHHRIRNQQGTQLITAHDGYVADFGLTHIRKLELSRDGRALTGEDTFCALDAAQRAVFDAHMTQISLQGVDYTVRFHLHPDVDPSLDLGGTAVSLLLKSGEVWVFRHSGVARLDLEPSVYLEKGRINPRASKQIVLSARVIEYASQVSWSLAKVKDAASGRNGNDAGQTLVLT